MGKPLDAHVHPSTREYLLDSGGRYLAHATQYFGSKIDSLIRTPEQMTQQYQEWGLRGVLLAWDAQTGSGTPPTTNDHIAKIVHKYPDVWVRGFASVDPWSPGARHELKRALTDLQLRGLKFQQAAQQFRPDDARLWPLYDLATEHKAPVLFHTGTTGYGAGTPGGDGIQLEYCHPRHLDRVAARFPELTIIGAHPSWPWQEEMLAIAVHKANIYIDLSGWSPKYFPPSLVQYANTLLQDKVMFGSDYPFLTPERWLKDFEKAGFKAEVREKILWGNAERVLGV